ncbi:AAA family ATPase [Streptomyces sp. PA5.6]|uniref:helix-turn-helix transcriptional regulator n=1 Tax=Streptomyces sp. PA5.6 TaxID=3035651 RepID=UPI003904A9F6
MGSGQGSGQAGRADDRTLVGRRREQALLVRSLENARTGARGSATVLRGDAGIGKTALLEWTVTRAAREGFTVLRVVGSESESGIAFGALHRVLLPLRENSRALPPHQRLALERALGLREGLPPAGFMVGAAALALLAEQARRGPVLMVVDDLQWVDASSAAVFVFLHQRIVGLPVVMVCASRSDGSALEGWPAHPVDVEALSGEDSRTLLRRWHPGLAAGAARRVLAEAAGNPLALAELPSRRLTDEHGGGVGVVPLPGEHDGGGGVVLLPGEHDGERASLPGEHHGGRVPPTGHYGRGGVTLTHEHRRGAVSLTGQQGRGAVPMTDEGRRGAVPLPGPHRRDGAPPTDERRRGDAPLPDEHRRDGIPLPDAHRRDGTPLPDAHHSGALPPPPNPLPPLGNRLEEVFVRRLRALPESAARVLLLAALDDAADVGGDAMRRAGQGTAEQDGTDPGGAERDSAERDRAERDRVERVLSAIEASGLARWDATGRLVFRHPLVRSAVIGAASAAERRTAHRTLAERLREDDPRRLLHEASAAEAPDERLAARLQEAGTRIALRGGDAEGALLLDRAAALGTGPGDRARRLTWAAVMSARGGRLAYAADLLREIRRGPVPEDIAPLFAYAVVYVDQSHHVDFASSFELLPGALEALTAPSTPDTPGAPGEPGAPGAPGMSTEPGTPTAPSAPAFGDLVEQMAFKLLLASAYTGDPRGWDVLERHREHLSPAVRLCHRAWADPPRTAHGAETELRSLVARVAARRETAAAWLLLWAASAVDAADEELRRLFDDEHTYATQGSVAKARCHQAFLRGRWDAAEECLREADTAEELGYHCNALLFRHYYAHFLAGRGDERGLRAVRARITPVAASARMRFVTDHLDRLDALAASAHGRYEEAYLQLRRIMPPGRLPRGLAWFHLPFFDFVVASLRCGRRAEARAHVAAGRAARMDTVSAHHAFLLAAATALTADDAESDAAYAAACAVPGAGEWVFDMARLRLLHGAALRRRGRRAEAVETLHAALRAFQGLGAEPWVEQCRTELRAADRTTAITPIAPIAPSDGLTAQELRVARLVSTGLTNKEVGAALQLSPRTVGAHLYRIFPKLGVTSRAALAGALPDS